MEMASWIISSEQAMARAKPRRAFSTVLKKSTYDQMGLGLGISDTQTATIDLGGRSVKCQLVRASLDPRSPDGVATDWVEIPERA